METMDRKTFGIRNTTNYMIVPFAKEPVRFTYMTAEDRIVPTGSSLLNYYDGPKQFRTLEAAQKVKASLEWRGIRHTNEVACNFMAVRPEQMEVRIMTVEEFLAFKAN